MLAKDREPIEAVHASRVSEIALSMCMWSQRAYALHFLTCKHVLPFWLAYAQAQSRYMVLLMTMVGLFRHGLSLHGMQLMS